MAKLKVKEIREALVAEGLPQEKIDPRSHPGHAGGGKRGLRHTGDHGFHDRRGLRVRSGPTGEQALALRLDPI